MNRRCSSRTAWSIAVLAIAVALVSCKTGKPGEKKGGEGKAAPPVEFRPVSPLSRIHFDEGMYPDLFASSSYTMWVDDRVNALRGEQAAKEGDAIDADTVVESAYIAENYVVLECHVDSMFRDMSIAYDVVGGRGVSVYLMTPDGRQVAPIQTLIGANAKEEARDALKLFGRTNLLVFQKQDLWRRERLAAPDAVAVRLVIEAYDSKYYFEWPGASAGAVWEPTAPELKEVLATGYREFHERVRLLLHKFD